MNVKKDIKMIIEEFVKNYVMKKKYTIKEQKNVIARIIISGKMECVKREQYVAIMNN